MKIIIDIPDPKFAVGDVVAYPNGYGKRIVVHIEQMMAIDGEWSSHSDGTVTTRVKQGGYLGVIQPGSYAMCEKNKELQPGLWLTYSLSDLELKAEKIDWSEPIVKGNTVENEASRYKAWKDSGKD